VSPLLSVRGVETFYGSIQALKGVDIDVNPGEIVTLIGANGAGKSTLMMTICGNPQARRGTIVYDGTDITRLPTHEIMRRRIAQSPEGRRIFARMSVFENRPISARISIRSSRCFRGSRNGATSAAAPCPAANSRCSPSPGR
jgi:branched-chain amino acid transport system ATP-binding protein